LAIPSSAASSALLFLTLESTSGLSPTTVSALCVAACNDGMLSLSDAALILRPTSLASLPVPDAAVSASTVPPTTAYSFVVLERPFHLCAVASA
jgi:hypothetical protein